MAHTCPDCGHLCYCNGDIDDIDMGEDINCKHWRQCELEDDSDDDDFYDYDDTDEDDHPLNPPKKNNCMGTRKNPATSLEDYHNLDSVRLSQTQQDIVRAVTALGEGNYESIAAFLMMKPEKIWKRLHEVERAGAIFKPGTTVVTKNGAKSYVYRPTKPGESTEPVIEKAMSGESVADYSRKLIPTQLTML